MHIEAILTVPFTEHIPDLRWLYAACALLSHIKAIWNVHLAGDSTTAGAGAGDAVGGEMKGYYEPGVAT